MNYSIYMTTFLSRVKTLFIKLTHFIPTKIPVGISEFESWASSIITTYGFPDNDSVRWALAVKILHAGETEAIKPKRYFFLALHKAMANQVVSQVIQDLKTKQSNETAAQAAQIVVAEVTAKPTVTSDVQNPTVQS